METKEEWIRGGSKRNGGEKLGGEDGRKLQPGCKIIEV